MPIHPEPSSFLPPLKQEVAPIVSIDSLLAVNDVHLTAADIPRGILRNFYQSILGLKFVPPTGPADADASIQFLHQRRRIVLSRDEAPSGHVAFLVKDFPEILQRLRSQSIPYELFHIDNGLTRTVLLRDAAGNFVHLVETRPL